MVLLLNSGRRFGNSPSILHRIFTVKFVVAIFLLFILAVLIINVYVADYGKKYIVKNPVVSGQFKTGLPVAIVLGASVYSDGRLSPVLEQRAMTAYELYSAGIVKKVLVSGDNHVENYNEVMPIRKYLLDKGVPPEDIFTDFAGFDTYDTMYRAVKIFGVKEAYVVTQSFHLPRSLYAARNVGLNAYGVAADKEDYYFRNNLREFFATSKTYFEVVTDAPSLFLGRQIPITGDGRESLE
jgi:SanA protein